MDIVVVELHEFCNHIVRKSFPRVLQIFDFLREVELYFIPHLVGNFSDLVLFLHTLLGVSY